MYIAEYTSSNPVLSSTNSFVLKLLKAADSSRLWREGCSYSSDHQPSAVSILAVTFIL
jgi:hypothetical protein